MPIEAISRPITPEISPLIRLPLVSVTMLVSPMTASRKFSGGPKRSENLASTGATSSSASVEMMPPQKLATVAIVIATPPLPLRVIG